MSAQRTDRPRGPMITFERIYAASLDDLWALWTTRDGIESWWGPEGFRVEVRALDLRPGGDLRYAMIAVGPDQVAFMTNAGLPLITEARLTYSEVHPKRRLAYVQDIDFVPGVAPYPVRVVVDFRQDGPKVRMALQSDPMHDALWTERATEGRESELRKLARLIEFRAA
jgi:uncharacterized protein YndB with AHSA1/START domain